MNIAAWLHWADQQLFYSINTGLSHPWLDQLMMILRTPGTWIPLYIGLLVFFYIKHPRLLLPLVCLSALCFAITDFTSASILKPLIGRLRPCHDSSLGIAVQNVIPCGGLYSMPSSHAANHFGLAALWFNMAVWAGGKRWYWVWIWAALICVAQIYVGVHFPSDVLAGALLGIMSGNICWQLYLRLVALQQKAALKKQLNKQV